jgi:hypothetical protein
MSPIVAIPSPPPTRYRIPRQFPVYSKSIGWEEHLDLRISRKLDGIPRTLWGIEYNLQRPFHLPTQTWLRCQVESFLDQKVSESFRGVRSTFVGVHEEPTVRANQA